MPEFTDNERLLVRYWMEKVAHEVPATMSDMPYASHPLFQKIVQIGAPAVPTILNELKRGRCGSWWFEALRQIVGSDPVDAIGCRAPINWRAYYAMYPDRMWAWHWWTIQRVFKRKMMRDR